MPNSIKAFEIELEKLLKENIGEDSYSNIFKGDDQVIKNQDQISEKIHLFYRDQLQININNYSERIKIDRTITFAQKSLPNKQFCEFLLKLGQLCLSSGKLTLAGEIFRKINSTSSETSHVAESLLGLADIYSRKANWSRSFKLISEAETLYKNLNDNLGLVKCANLSGSVFGEKGDIDKAIEQFNVGLSLINPESEPELVAALETNIGVVENIKGNSAGSIRHLNRALSIYKRLELKKNEAEVNLNMGLVYLESGMTETAIGIFDEGISLAKEGRFMSSLCMLYLAKSQALIAINTFHYATEFADKALEISHFIDDKLTLADLYRVKGILERRVKNYKASENFLMNSLRINTSLKNEMNIAETSFELAMLYKEMDKNESKQSYLKNSIDYFRQISAPDKIRRIEELIGTEAA